MFTVNMRDLPWKLQNETRAPLDKPVITLSMHGDTMQIHKGRCLLKWTRWMLVSEFAEYIASL